MTGAVSGLLSSLIRSNTQILSQKVAFIDALILRHGSKKGREKFAYVCPLVGASVGQHIRHSMDHVELIALVAAEAVSPSNGGPSGVSYDPGRLVEIHYDLR